MTSKAETLKRIIDAARNNFAVSGFQNASMETIAREAGVTKQLLYHYYGSKNDLFEAVLNEQAETILSALTKMDLTQMTTAEGLRRFLEFAFDQYRADPAVPALAQEAIAFHKEHGQTVGRFAVLAPALHQKMTELIERGIERGEFRADADADLFPAMAVLATLGGFYNAYMLSGLAGFDTTSPEGMDRWRNYAIDFVVSAILPKSTVTGAARPI